MRRSGTRMETGTHDPARAEALRVISGGSLLHTCPTCFHSAEAGCSIGADPSRQPCPYWAISFRLFLRAVEDWERAHPGQIQEASGQGSRARGYALERYRASSEGFYPASCKTCTHWRPGASCQPRSGPPCKRWRVSLAYFLMGGHLWRLLHPWPEN